MKVKPAVEGAIIRDPMTRMPLPAEGGEVPDNNFWRRRIMHGEVVLVTSESTPPTGLEGVVPLTTREGT